MNGSSPGCRAEKIRELLGRELTGWRRNAVAYVLGALMTLTLAPIFAFPLIIPSFTGLYWLVDSASTKRRRFLDGWWWGWGFHMTGLSWICVALLTDPEAFAWLIPFALFGLTGAIAIFAGIAAWLMSWIRVSGLPRLVAFSSIWMVVEYTRGHIFTGFPWNLPGYSFGFSLASLQAASLVGIYGLTGFTVLLGSSFAASKMPGGRRYILMLWALFAAVVAWGQWRQSGVETTYVDGVMLRLVQANIPQTHKWDPHLQMQNIRDHIHLTQSPGLEKITHVIWPESAVPFVIESGNEIAHILGNTIPNGTLLITGALRSEGDKEHFRVWNSLAAVDHDGTLMGSYDKIHLVPFGEFQPLRPFVPKEWMTPVGDTDFSSGNLARTLTWPGLPPMIPLICYEAIFPEMSFGSDERPQMLLTITDDAWFGKSLAPYQHFHMARMRAVEQGVPLVRDAVTGITAVVDAYGRITAMFPLGEMGVLDARLPKPLPTSTIYAKYGDIMVLLGLIAAVSLVPMRKRKKNP